MPIEIFYSYAHNDEALRDRLEKHLASLKNAGLIKGWHDRRISAGTEWDRQIDEHLNSADIILLLISADFIASSYCTDTEVKQALTRHEAGTARVIPIILHPCYWTDEPFGKLQALPKNAHPISLWANQEEAFLDIVQGIRAAIVDLEANGQSQTSARATHVSSSTRHSAAAARIPDFLVVDFVARRDSNGQDIVTLLRTELAPQQHRLVVLWGAGGVGKTTLAAEAARTLLADFKGRIVWTSALGRKDYTLSTLLDEIGTQLDHPELRPLASEPKTEAVRALLVEAPTLIILDNFESVAEAEQKSCAGFLHHAPAPALITTRQKVDGARNLLVDALTTAEARAYLRLLIAQTNDRDTFAQLDHNRIIEAAAHNPLLLQWVVAQIDAAQDPTAVLEDLARGAGDAAECVFARSFNLPQLTDDGRATLLALSLFKPDAARAALAEVAGFEADVPRLQTALKRLAGLWLIKTTEAGQRVTLQGLTRQLAQARLARDSQANDYRRRFVAHFLHYARTYKEAEPSCYDALEAERENLLSAAAAAAACEDWARAVLLADTLMHPSQGVLSVRGYWDDALWLGELALGAARSLQNEAWVAQVAHNVGILYQHRGELHKARQLYDESLEIKKKYGNEAGIASTLNQLAWLAQGEGKSEEARQLGTQSLRVSLRLGDRRGAAGTHHLLGHLARDRGDLDGARRHYTASLEIDKQLGDRRGIAMAQLNLAEVSQAQGKHKQARQLYNESLHIFKLLGDQSGIASAQHSLGNLAYIAGAVGEARRLYRESLEIVERLGDQRGTATTLAQLGLLAAKEGDKAEATRLLREALRIFERLESRDAEKARQLLARVESAGE